MVFPFAIITAITVDYKWLFNGARFLLAEPSYCVQDTSGMPRTAYDWVSRIYDEQGNLWREVTYTKGINFANINNLSIFACRCGSGDDRVKACGYPCGKICGALSLNTNETIPDKIIISVEVPGFTLETFTGVIQITGNPPIVIPPPSESNCQINSFSDDILFKPDPEETDYTLTGNYNIQKGQTWNVFENGKTLELDVRLKNADGVEIRATRIPFIFGSDPGISLPVEFTALPEECSIEATAFVSDPNQNRRSVDHLNETNNPLVDCELPPDPCLEPCPSGQIRNENCDCVEDPNGGGTDPPGNGGGGDFLGENQFLLAASALISAGLIGFLALRKGGKGKKK